MVQISQAKLAKYAPEFLNQVLLRQQQQALLAKQKHEAKQSKKQNVDVEKAATAVNNPRLHDNKYY